jgi:uncharacterized protein (DUF1684 family)
VPRSILPLLLALSAAAPGDYAKGVERFRHEREAKVFGRDGWSHLAGLFFLAPGVSRLGTAPGSEVRFPSGPPLAARLKVEGDTVRIEPEPGVLLEDDKGPLPGPRELKPDTSGSRDVIRVGGLALQVLKRHGRFAVRLWDNSGQGGGELEWFPIHEEYRVVATFHASPKTIPVATILGYTEPMESPGYVTFHLAGKELRLEPVLEEAGAGELFFLFKDATAGETTYPAGRFLYAPLPDKDRVVLDFNEAFAPPCAFTRYATCPIPPKQNQLPLRIEAGERGLGH